MALYAAFTACACFNALVAVLVAVFALALQVEAAVVRGDLPSARENVGALVATILATRPFVAGCLVSAGAAMSAYAYVEYKWRVVHEKRQDAARTIQSTWRSRYRACSKPSRAPGVTAAQRELQVALAASKSAAAAAGYVGLSPVPTTRVSAGAEDILTYAAGRLGVPPSRTTDLLSWLSTLEQFEGEHAEAISDAAYHILHGLMTVGRCTQCTLDAIAAGTVAASGVCGHHETVGQEAASSRTTVAAHYVPTGKRGEEGVDWLTNIQFITSVLVLAESGAGKAAVANALVAGLRVALERSGFTETEMLEVAMAILGDEMRVCGLTAKEFSAAALRALTTNGDIGEDLPAWLAYALRILGKVTGLSCAASLTTALVPAYVLRYCREARISPGSLINDAVSCACDLAERCERAYREGKLEPLWRVEFADSTFRELAAILRLTPSEVPGEGFGAALIESRRRYLHDAHDTAHMLSTRLPYGQERVQAMRIAQGLYEFLQRCEREYHGPTGRPRAINFAIVGPAGVGKSEATDVVFMAVMGALGLPYDRDMVFKKNGGTRWWDGIDSGRQVLYTIDEWGQAAEQEADSGSRLVQLLGEAPHALECADVNQINKNWASQYCTVVTSNRDDLGARQVAVCPGALYRRFAARIRIEAHPSVRRFPDDPAATEISDVALANATMDSDIWAGEVTVPVVKGDNTEWRPIARFSSMRGLLAVVQQVTCEKAQTNQAFRHFKGTRDAAMMAAAGTRHTIPRVVEPVADGTIPAQPADDDASDGAEPEELNTTGRRSILVALDVLRETLRTEGASWFFTTMRSSAVLLGWDALRGHASTEQVLVHAATWLAASPWVPYSLPVSAMLMSVAAVQSAHARIAKATASPSGDSWPLWAALAYVTFTYGVVRAFAHLNTPWTGVAVVASCARARALEECHAARVRWRMLGTRGQFVVVFSVAIMAFGAWWSTREPTAEEAAPRAPQRLNVAAKFGMTETEWLAYVKTHPTDWHLRVKDYLQDHPLVMRDNAEWDARARARAAVGAVPQSMLPRALGAEGRNALVRELHASTFRCKLTWQAGDKREAVDAIATCIAGTIYAINEHVWMADRMELRLFPRDPSENPLASRVHLLTNGVNSIRVPGRDLRLVVLATVPRTNLRKKIADSVPLASYVAGTRASVLMPEDSGRLKWFDTSVAKSAYLYHHRLPDGQVLNSSAVDLRFKCQEGQSGSPAILGVEGGAVLAGIIGGWHTRWGEPTTVIIPLVGYEIDKVVAELMPSYVTCARVVGLDFTSVKWDAAAPHFRSWLYNAGDEAKHFLYLGTTRSRVSVRSRYAKAPLSLAWPPIERWAVAHGADKYAVPAFKGFVGPGADGEAAYADPQLHKTRGARGDTTHLPELLRAATIEYLSGLPGKMRPRKPLTYEEAVFGAPGVAPLDLRRSAGADLGGRKAAHVDEATRTLKPHLLAAVETIEADIRATAVAPGHLKSMLKRELRKIAKCAAGVTRHISPITFAWLIVLRRWMLPLVQELLASGPEASTMAIGVNAADPRQWGEILDMLMAVTEDGMLMDGDFADYDLNAQVDEAEAGARIWGEIADRCSYDPEEQFVVYALCVLCEWCTVDIDTVVVLLLQGTHSGKYGTDSSNSVRLFLKLCVAWYLCAAREGVKPPSFREVCRLISVGDDHVVAVPRAFRGWYNAARIHDALKPIGDIYTNALKNLDFEGTFRPPEEITFLQRAFVRTPSGVLAPIETSRIARSLYLCEPSLAVTQESHAYSTLMNAQHEAFMHGRAFFDSFQAAMPGQPLVMPDGSKLVARFLNYADLETQWANGRLQTWESGGQVFGLPGVADEDQLTDLNVCAAPSTAVDLGGVVATPSTSAVTAEIASGEVVAIAPSAAGRVPQAAPGAFEDTMHRPVTIDSVSLTSASTGIFLNFSAAQLWAQFRSVTRKLSNSRFLKGGVLRVYISIATTPQHRGAAVFAPILTSLGTRGTTYLAQQLVQMDSVFRVLSGPQTVDIDLPLLTAAGDIVVMDDVTDSSVTILPTGIVQMAILSPLSHCSLTAVPPVNVVVRTALVQGELVVPSDYTPYTVTSKQSVASETTQQGIVAQGSAMVANVLRGVGATFPLLAPFATPAAMVASGVEGLARLMGFGRPTGREPPMLVALASNPDLTSTGVVDRAPSLGMDVANTTSPHPGAGGWPKEDQMSLRYLENRFQIIAGSSNYAEWPSTSAAGTILMSVPVTPAACDAGADASQAFVQHPAMLIGSWFYLWRGDAEYKVVACGGSMDAGRLYIVYNPGTGRSSGVLDPLQKYSALIDLQAGNTTAELKVGWASEETYLALPQSFANIPATQYGAVATSTMANGSITVYVDSPLVSNQATTSIGLKIFARFKGLQFALPSLALPNSMQYTGKPSSPDYHPCSKEGVLLEVPKLSDDRETLYASGDTCTHLRELLTRYYPEMSIGLYNTAASSAYLNYIWYQPCPCFQSSSTVPFSGYGGKNASCMPIHMALKAYQVCRGGTSRRFLQTVGQSGNYATLVAQAVCTLGAYIPVWSTSGLSTSLSPSIQTWASAAGSSLTHAIFAAQGNGATLSGLALFDSAASAASGTVTPNNGAPFCGASVPYRGTRPWMPCSLPPLASATLTYTEAMAHVSLYVNSTTIAGAGYTGPVIETFRRSTDDVVFNGFCGMPAISAGTWPY